MVTDRLNETIAIEHENVGHSTTTAKETHLEALAKGQVLSGYETLTVWETIKTFKVCTFVCFMMAFSGATDGYQVGINGNIIANPGFVVQFATETNAAGEPVLASPILSAWSSVVSVGQIIGMTSMPFISDRYGRKVSMYTFWFILASSVLCESVATTWPVWLVGKLLSGIGVGCLQMTVPSYIAEVAPNRIRGALLMLYNFWFNLGIFFAPVALQVLSKNMPLNYRTPIYTQWSQIGLMIIIYVFIPESPAWLIANGKIEKAKKALLQLHWLVCDYDVDKHYYLWAIAIEHEKEVAKQQENEKWHSIFKGTDGLRTIISCWTLLTQQFTGLTLFFTFGSYFFQQAGIEDPFQATCITSGINIATGIVVILSADKVGRRLLSCSGSTISWVSNVAIGILGVVPHNRASKILLVFFACLWNVGTIATGCTGWGFIGEISSQRLRVYTAGFGAAAAATAGVIMNVLTPYMVNSNQWNWSLRTGWFYAGVGLPFVIMMWLLIPETKGLSAAEMDELFEGKVKPWRFHLTQTATQRAVMIGPERVENS